MEENSTNLLFNPKDKCEVIKVPNCTYENDTKTMSTFYFCQCNKEDFYPICEACSNICHNKHHPSLTIKGIYTCKCGEKNHHITKEAEELFKKRRANRENKCFYQSFFSITPNNGFYAYKGKTYCAVCVHNCRSTSFNMRKSCKNEMDDADISSFSKEITDHFYMCQCKKHFDNNVATLNLDLLSKPKLHLQFENYNFNILSRNKMTNEKYIKVLVDNLRRYEREETIEHSKLFFSDLINLKILELFSFFSVKWENKFFYVKDYFEGISRRVLVSLMLLTENPAEMDEGLRANFFSAKFYYSELVFNYIVRSFQIDYNNLWNIRTILNMNLFQRKLYIQDNKTFFKYHNYSLKHGDAKVKEPYDHELVQAFISNLLDLYDNMLKISESDKTKSGTDNIIFSYAFPTFTRIFKYLIKYHFVNFEQSCKYFDLVFDTVKLWNEGLGGKDLKPEEGEDGEEEERRDEPQPLDARQTTSEFFAENRRSVTFNNRKPEKLLRDKHLTMKMKESEENDSNRLKRVLHIMKSILYCLIYNNDKVCINYLHSKKDINNNKFTFIKNDTSDKMCKIFMSIINLFHRKENISHTIIYDFYVRKILELLTNKDDFYLTSLLNLKSIPQYEISILTATNPFEEAKRTLHEPFLEEISRICKRLHFVNRKYFDYEIQLPEFIAKANMIINKELKGFTQSQIQYVPNLQCKYLAFGFIRDPNVVGRIAKLQDVAKYTPFFQVIEECAHIYSRGKKFAFENGEPKINIDMNAQRELMTFLLDFMFLLIYKNQENLCLFMNISPKCFIATFIDADDKLFLFFDRLTEMMYSTSYTFDNYYFYTECLCHLVRNVFVYFDSEVRTEEKDVKKLGYLGQVLKMTGKWINRITINQPDLLNVIDSIQNFINAIYKRGSRLSDIPELFAQYLTNPEKREGRTLGIVIGYYLLYLSEMIQNDSDFYGYNNFKCFLFDISLVLKKPVNLFEEKPLPIELEYSIISLYFSAEVSFKFSIYTIQNQLLKLFESTGEEEEDEVISKVTLPYLSIQTKTSDQKDIDNELRKNIEKYKKLAGVQLLLNQRFRTRLQEAYAKLGIFPCLIMVKVFLFHYFEKMLVRPIYKLMNYLMLHGSLIDGADCIPFQQLVYEFLRNVVFFYDNINKHVDVSYKKDTEEHYSSIEGNKEIYDYENISLSLELSYNQLQEILADMSELKQKVKYYHIEKQYEILMKTIEVIFNIKPKDILSLRTQTMKSKRKKMKDCSYLKRTNSLIEKYKAKKASTFDTKLSLFSALEASEKEMDTEIIKEMLLYLLSKLSDQLTDEAITSRSSGNGSDNGYNCYIRGTIHDICLSKFKSQNSWVLIYLNALFFNYSENYQQCCSECLGDQFFNIFEFFAKDLIFASSLREITKLYQLDYVRSYNPLNGEREPTLSYEICMLSIKLLQNLCEAHNQIFQNRFFNYKFPIEKYSYISFKNYEEESARGVTLKTTGFLLKEFSEKVGAELKEKKPERLKIQNMFQLMVKAYHEEKVLEVSENEFESEKEEEKKKKEPLLSDQNLIKKLQMKKEKDELFFLQNNQFSFFSFIVQNMRIINENLHMSQTLQSSLLRMTHRITCVDNIININQRYSDLIVEMIQGTQNTNFKHFYKKLLEKNALFNELGQVNHFTLNAFAFLKHCREVGELLFNPLTLFNEQMLSTKTNLFIIMNNVISQELYDSSPVQIFIVLFPPEKLMSLIAKYLRGLAVKHIESVEYESRIFDKQFDEMELNNKRYSELKRIYKTSMDIFEDPFFKLASQIYLFLTILGKKYSIQEAERIITFNENETSESHQDGEEHNGNKSIFYTALASAQDLMKKKEESRVKDPKTKTLAKEAVLIESPVSGASVLSGSRNEANDFAFTAKFFNYITKSCEFVFERNDEKILKTIYIIVDPRAFYVSKTNIVQFLDEVDRSSSTTKLKSLINILTSFMYEVEYKYQLLKESDSIQWIYSIDYKDIDIVNFYISLLINLMLMLFLRKGSWQSGYVRIFSGIIAGLQVAMNLLVIAIYLMSKFKFNIILAKSRYEGKKLEWVNYPRIYLIDSFFLNEEIYLIILIVIIGSIAVISPYASFLYAFQLLTVVKFVPTIKEIIIAFKLRFNQLLSMIGFLAILIFFYANVGFAFYSQEFSMEMGDGIINNTCSSLLECAITFFDQGVRSGGGVGDILPDKEYNTGIFWLLWVNDVVFFITVILLLLNMINGVIVSTFSQIREESNEKEDDINNKCFICNIERVEFEKRKCNFNEHTKSQHNVQVYIYFLISLKLIFEKDLDADQTFIIEGMNNKEIKFFPVLQTKSIGDISKDEDNDDENQE